MGHELQTIANAENRNPHLENLGGRKRSFFLVDALRSPREDDGSGRFLLDSSRSGIERKNLGEDPELPCFSGDELRVLGAKIEDNDLYHFSILSEERKIVNAVNLAIAKAYLLSKIFW
jgi:hypothetical protein